jgi:hypothetical protein
MGDTEGFPPHHEVEFYRLYRERIVTEDTLLFQRLSWLITAQTVMFSFTAIAFFRGGLGQIDTAGTLLMSVLGVVMCSLGGLGVWAASHRIDEVKEEYVRKHPTGTPHPALPSLVGETKAHRLGKLAPLMVPPLFLVAWIAILVVALR